MIDCVILRPIIYQKQLFPGRYDESNSIILEKKIQLPFFPSPDQVFVIDDQSMKASVSIVWHQKEMSARVWMDPVRQDLVGAVCELASHLVVNGWLVNQTRGEDAWQEEIRKKVWEKVSLIRNHQ